MKKGQDTRGYQRYMALDIHREYILVGARNEEKDWVLTPRRVSTEKFPEWAKKNIRSAKYDLRLCSYQSPAYSRL
jgi:hypothetical protein